MALVRWQPIYELNSLNREVNRLFEQLGMAPWTDSDAGFPVNGQGWAPAVELQETEAAYILRAELPGIKTEDLDVQVTRNAVQLTGEHRAQTQTEQKSYFRSELRYGKFQRLVRLPGKIENEQVQAEFKDGILTLTLPKLVDEQRKVVRVNLTAPAAQPSDNHSPEN
jgi:HSP20 family protein